MIGEYLDRDDDESLPESLRAAATTSLPPQQRAYLAKYGAALVVGFLIVAAAGGFLIYEDRTAPETETQIENVATWTPDAGFEHGATVQNDTAVFDRGDRLVNRPVYFTAIAPELDGSYVIDHELDGADAPATGTAELRVVLQATEEIGDEEVIHWRRAETVATETIDGLDPGEERRLGFDVNATALDEQIDEIEAGIGASPGSSEVVLVAETTLEAEPAGDHFVHQRTDRLELSPDGGTYSVDADLDEAGNYPVSDTVEVPVERSPMPLYAGIVLLVIGLAGAGATGYARYAGLFRVTAAERRRLAFEQARNDYDKWISSGRVPEADDRTVIELVTLEDLVNVAIDSDRRVIERESGPPRYDVIIDDIRYTFEPPDPVRNAGAESTTPDDEPAIPDDELAAHEADPSVEKSAVAATEADDWHAVEDGTPTDGETSTDGEMSTDGETSTDGERPTDGTVNEDVPVESSAIEEED